MDFAFLYYTDQSKIFRIMVCQRNRRIHIQSGFFGCFVARDPRDLGVIFLVKKRKIPFADSFGFNNLTHPKFRFWLHLNFKLKMAENIKQRDLGILLKFIFLQGNVSWKQYISWGEFQGYKMPVNTMLHVQSMVKFDILILTSTHSLYSTPINFCPNQSSIHLLCNSHGDGRFLHAFLISIYLVFPRHVGGSRARSPCSSPSLFPKHTAVV